MKPCIFLDRDGVIIADNHLITSIDQCDILPRVPDALAKLRSLGFLLILVSNQTVVSRGLLSYEEMVNLNQALFQKIKSQNANAFLDDAFFSPYHPKAQVEKYRCDHESRKPRPGMILEAQKKHGIDLTKSYMVGDRLSDIYAGNSVGVKTVLVNPHTESTMIETEMSIHKKYLTPDLQFFDLMAFAESLS